MNLEAAVDIDFRIAAAFDGFPFFWVLKVVFFLPVCF